MASTPELLLKWQEKQPINETVYKTKKIQFLGRDTRFILQNKNGPCPLIAICNVLLLNGKINLGADQTLVSEAELLRFVAESLFNSLDKEENGTITVADAIDLTRSLPTGMNVGVKFTRIDDFELTKENRVFGLLGIRLVHGWLVDPQDAETANAIGSKSYDTLTGELAAQRSQGSKAISVKKSKEDNVEVEHFEKEDIDPTSANSYGVTSESSKKMKETIAEFSSLTATNLDGIISEPTSNVAESSSLTSTSNVNEGELIKCFVDNNPTHLTVYGLCCLQEGLKEQELCVFFRNNHFNMMFRYIGELYILVTDEGYTDKPGVIWEKLTKVNGDTIFVNSYFMNFTLVNDIDEIPKSDSESVKKKDGATVLKEFEDQLEGLEGSSSFNPDIQEALGLLGIDEKDFDRRQVENPGPKPEAGNPSPKPEMGMRGPKPRLKRDYSNSRRERMPSKKVIKRIIKEKCYLM